MAGALIDRGHEGEFIFAGNAKFTALRTDNGNRITYQLKRVKPTKRMPVLKPGWQDAYWVLYKYNEDLTDGRGYTYVGVLFDKSRFWVSRRTIQARRDYTVRAKLEHGAKCFQWLIDHLLRGALPETVQIWHMGSCGRCGKTLTVPLSIHRGIGPECMSYQGELQDSLASLGLEYLERVKKGVN